MGRDWRDEFRGGIYHNQVLGTGVIRQITPLVVRLYIYPVGGFWGSR
jgi:hypothetical protein